MIETTSTTAPLKDPPQLDSYVLIKKLGESLQAKVYQGYHKHIPECPLVVKYLKQLSSWDNQSRHLRQKIDRLRVLHDPRTCTPLTLESNNNDQFIIQPLLNGQPLNVWTARQQTLKLADFFRLACSLANTVRSVHDAGIPHGGIKPHNILVQAGSLNLRLIDFITSLDSRDVSHFIYDPEFVSNTLAYTSPKQSGGINYRVDFSTDLYSLGAESLS
ncbi:MAG: hypothetical protein BVN35_03260 [Proteobacteria bacterium ST_bin11]|nr:MAG: hypothetical protein BVN35_03260 [Proteobacteria bacterium ST_bin11]